MIRTQEEIEEDIVICVTKIVDSITFKSNVERDKFTEKTIPIPKDLMEVDWNENSRIRTEDIWETWWVFDEWW